LGCWRAGHGARRWGQLLRHPLIGFAQRLRVASAGSGGWSDTSAAARVPQLGECEAWVMQRRDRQLRRSCSGGG
jgi:hypothetical protein